MITIIKNFFFCLRYPFWRVRNVWTGKKLSYSRTHYDQLPEGWRKAFGKKLSEDLRKALKKDKFLHKAYFHLVKEKYGTLRLYMNFYGDNTSKVVNHYEDLSRCYCIECGKPSRYVSRGWIEYYCADCAPKYIKKECLEECRLTVEDIPTREINVWDNEKKEYVWEKKYIDIDFKKMWELTDGTERI